MEKSYQNMSENRIMKYLKYFCEHEKYKYQCRECKGSQICPHNRRKSHCKECEGTQVCPHNRQKQTCKECGGAQICPHNRQKYHCKKCSEPIKVNIKQWIFNRRKYDKMNNIYDADRFIDKCFLKGLVEDYKQCYYVEIAKSTYNIQNIKMILRQSKDLIIRLDISRAIAFYVA